MATFSNIIKGLSIKSVVYLNENRGGEVVPHIIVGSNSGAVFDLQPSKGLAATIGRMASSSASPQVAYAWTGNKIYVHLGDGSNGFPTLLEYDPVLMRVTQVFSPKDFAPQYNNDYQPGANTRAGEFWNNDVSTDGHAYFFYFQAKGLPAMARIANGSVDIFNQNPDPQAEVEQGLELSQGFNFTGSPSALQGVYAWYLYSDDYDHLFDTIISEATTAGVTFETDTPLFRLHTDDRATGSAARRVTGSMNVSGVDSVGVYVNRVIDLKNITDITTDLSGGSNAAMSTLTGVHGIAAPNYPIQIAYANTSRHVGKFAWASYYLNNSSNFYGLHYALEDRLGFVKGQMIFPTNRTWDRDTVLPNNAGSSAGAYMADFNGDYGHGIGAEPVLFTYDPDDGTTIGFLRYDNYAFEAYNPNSPLAGHSFTALNTLTEYGCSIKDDASIVTIGGIDMYSTAGFTAGLFPEFEIIADADFDICDVVFTYYPDKNEHFTRKLKCYNVPMNTGTPAAVIELGAGQVIVAGLLYAAYQGGTISGSVFTPVFTKSSNLSIYNAIRFDANTAIFSGYFSSIATIDSSDVLTKISLPINRGLYLSDLDSTYAIVSGSGERLIDYKDNYCYIGYLDVPGKIGGSLSNPPKEFDPLSGEDFRILLGLTKESYTETEATTAANNYAVANGLILQDVINLGLATCKYYSAGVACYDGTKTIHSLGRKAISGFSGITINDQIDLLGTSYDEDEGLATDYPITYYINDADPTTLIEADYKTVEFQVAGLQGISTLGRVAESTNYIAFLKTNNASSQVEIRIVSKSNYEAAATGSGIISSFDNEVTISLGSSSTLYGFGPGENGYGMFSKYDKRKNFFFTVGNKLYATVITAVTSGGSKPAIYEIDLSTGAVVIYARLNTDSPKTMNYNPDTDLVTVCAGTNFYTFYLAAVTAPYDII